MHILYLKKLAVILILSNNGFQTIRHVFFYLKFSFYQNKLRTLKGTNDIS